MPLGPIVDYKDFWWLSVKLTRGNPVQKWDRVNFLDCSKTYTSWVAMGLKSFGSRIPMYLNFCVAKIFEIFSTIIWRLPHQITTNFELWICEFFLKCYIFVLIFFTTKKTNLLLIEKPLTYEAFFSALNSSLLSPS